MTEKKLYALTDDHVEVLKAWAEYGLSISTDHKELGETADAIHALTPMGCRSDSEWQSLNLYHPRLFAMWGEFRRRFKWADALRDLPK